MEVEIAGDGGDAGFQGLSGLVAWSGAEIEERLARAKIEEGDYRLGANVLNAEGRGVAGKYAPSAGDVGGGFEFETGGRGPAVGQAHPGFGAVEKRAGDGGGGVAAVVAIPAVEQPGGHGEIDGAGAIGDGVAVNFTEDGVDEAGGGRVGAAFGKLDAFTDGGMGRNAVEEAELVDTEAEREADFGIESGGFAAGEVADEEIELSLMAKGSEDELGGESGVSGVELGGGGEEQIRGIGPDFDTT